MTIQEKKFHRIMPLFISMISVTFLQQFLLAIVRPAETVPVRPYLTKLDTEYLENFKVVVQ